tara:strand:- start:104 stop:277 length:174 start_codon:yes stop_codon:yes gene_type:complete
LFENFEWYDFAVILFFANIMSTLLLSVFFGGGFISGILLVTMWEGWKFYEGFRKNNS